MGGETAFADDEEHFILDVVRQGYATQLQAAHPSGYVRVLHGVEHVAELVFLLGSIGIGSGADVFVQFFVIVIFYLLADGCQQAVTFSDFMLSAALGIHFLHFGHGVQFAAVYLLLQFPVAYNSGCGCHEGKGNQANNQYPHGLPFLEKHVPLIERTKIHIVLYTTK